jgi:predicted ArsR family transcriptional regulator
MANTTRFDDRFFDSTRGRIVTLLRRGNLTVNELVAELSLTDNAVRAHLLSLERDGLVVQKGTVRGHRKPHFVYGISEKARDLFPRPYGTLFNRLLSSLKATLRRPTLEARLREVGKSIGDDVASPVPLSREARFEQALTALESLGGSARVTYESGEAVIQSDGCPFTEAVEEHPEVCKVTESLLESVLQTDVKEACDRSTSPKCRFIVSQD